MTQISILGCGWLGFSLAKALTKKGCKIKGSTTSLNKVHGLKSEGIEPFIVNISEQFISESVSEFLAKSSILIVAIPPKLRGNQPENFVAKIKNLIPFIEKSSVDKLLFISSTSVYANNSTFVTEETSLNPDSENGNQLAIVEQILKENSKFSTTILRFGGLIDDDRHPVQYLSGRENIENPDSPINLIHRLDCIGIIEKIIDLGVWNETFNAVTPFHPSRKTYYTQKAIDLKLALPTFVSRNSESGKIIFSKKVIELLDYSFKKQTL